MAGNKAVAARMRRAADLMRQRGLTVGAFQGWEGAGRSADFTPRAVTCHHTAATVDVDRILRDGRADLPGPLCNWALHRDGSWWLVASGRANHAGVGWLPSSASYGIEATGPIPITNTGVDAFPNYNSYVVGVACILLAEGWQPNVVYAHKETCAPDGRKPDPAFGDPFPKPYRDMDVFRGRVAQAMTGDDVDMTPEESRQLKAVHDGLIVPGTTNPDQTVDLLFARVRELQQGMVVPGTKTVGEAYEKLFARVRAIEGDVQTIEGKLDEVLALLTAPTPPPV